jgi:hypothetical protein
MISVLDWDMATVSSALYKSQIQDYYYTRRAESSIGTGDRFLISSAVFGTSSLVKANSDGTYDISDIPTDFALSDLETNIAKGKLTLSHSAGVITCRVDLDTSSFADSNTAYPFNTLAVLDNEGVPIVVMCTQQDSLYTGKSYVAVVEIDKDK